MLVEGHTSDRDKEHSQRPDHTRASLAASSGDHGTPAPPVADGTHAVEG